MHRRLREFEALLASWTRSDYGAFWLKIARQPHGVIRVRSGQIIPVVHAIALGDRSLFLAPPQRTRDGHRAVGSAAMASGRALDDGELPLGPEIRMEVVTDPVMLAHAARGEAPPHMFGVREPSVMFSIPARLLLAPDTWPKKAFVLYQHIFGAPGSYPNDGYFYVGVTTRSWQARWAEHRRAVETGSPLLFHRGFREELAAGRVTYVHHKVMAITDDLEALYNTEEFLVQGHWEDERRLNMIPGGKSGLKYLREHGLLSDRVVPLPDERDRILADWLREHPRKGLPAPWVSEKWKDDAWAVAQICGRDGRLSVDQVRAIRQLADAHSAEEIAARIGALNVAQVQRVLDGHTYTRVQ